MDGPLHPAAAEDIEKRQPVWTALVLLTASVKYKFTKDTGYGYYLLIVKESPGTPGSYERVRVGVCVSRNNRASQSWSGRKAPQNLEIMELRRGGRGLSLVLGISLLVCT